MRWIPFAILTYLLVLASTTVAGILSLPAGPLGNLVPDLLAMLTVYVAMHLRSGTDVMLAGWVAGFCVDLATGGGPGTFSAVGPMAIAYALAGGLIFRVREAFFREQAVAQIMLAIMFCLLAHWLWVTLQSVLAFGMMTWQVYWRMVGQAAGISAYTGVLMPLAHWSLGKCRPWILAVPANRSRRRTR